MLIKYVKTINVELDQDQTKKINALSVISNLNVKLAIKLHYYFYDTCLTLQKYTDKSFLKLI